MTGHRNVDNEDDIVHFMKILNKLPIIVVWSGNSYFHSTLTPLLFTNTSTPLLHYICSKGVKNNPRSISKGSSCGNAVYDFSIINIVSIS